MELFIAVLIYRWTIINSPFCYDYKLLSLNADHGLVKNYVETEQFMI